MKLLDAVVDSVKKLDSNDLTLIYQQIVALESTKTKKDTSATKITIEQLHEMTKHDKSNWSDSVIAEREERL